MSELAQVPPPRARYVAASERSVTAALQRRVAGADAETLLRDKFDQDAPTPEARAEIRVTADRMTELLTMPTAPASLQRRARVALLDADEHVLSEFTARHGVSLRSLTRYARARAEVGAYVDAESALTLLHEHGLSADAHVYSAVLVSYARAAEQQPSAHMAERARALLQRMRAEAEPVTLTPVLVSAYLSALIYGRHLFPYPLCL